jgi:hypothetical protein
MFKKPLAKNTQWNIFIIGIKKNNINNTYFTKVHITNNILIHLLGF